MLLDIRSSISDLQLYREEPALWLLKHHPDYLYRTGGSPATLRGHAVEHGIRTFTRFFRHGMSVDTAIRFAQRRFLREVPDAGAPELLKYEEEFTKVPDYILQACRWLIDNKLCNGYVSYQHKVEGVIEGIKLLGYTDFVFSDPDGVLHGIDIKSTDRVPSEMRDTHVEQMAFYRLITGQNWSCLYVSTKRAVAHTLTDEQYHVGLARIRSTLKSMKAALALPDWQTLFTIFPPRDLSGFRWDDQARFYASNIWSIHEDE